jgi:hypothetical protein
MTRRRPEEEGTKRSEDQKGETGREASAGASSGRFGSPRVGPRQASSGSCRTILLLRLGGFLTIRADLQ